MLPFVIAAGASLVQSWFVPAPSASVPAVPAPSAGSPGPEPAPAPDLPRTPSPTDPADPTGQVRRSGTLVMTDYTAYDLDSKAANWSPTGDDWGPDRDVAYASRWADADGDAVIGRKDPKYVALLSGGGPWQRADCVHAPYSEPSARPVGDRLTQGRAICVVTSAKRYALLVVTGKAPGQLTVRVTVWQ
ncbi:hypothetical protein [Micromonospora haikouensis]|uniref:hypothetical protein n=1 Tax=Micromonospora haikouensis TaxID=686309 RepID=UPI00379018BE